MEVSALLGIREILELGDFGFPILFNKSDDDESIVVKFFAVVGVKRGCVLCSSLRVTI
jgi:hypothetical protein